MGNKVDMAELPETYSCTPLVLFEPHYGEHNAGAGGDVCVLLSNLLPGILANDNSDAGRGAETSGTSLHCSKTCWEYCPYALCFST